MHIGSDEGIYLVLTDGTVVDAYLDDDDRLTNEANLPVPEEEADAEADECYPVYLESVKQGRAYWHRNKTMRELDKAEAAARHAFYFGPRGDAVENKRRYLAEQKP